VKRFRVSVTDGQVCPGSVDHHGAFRTSQSLYILTSRNLCAILFFHVVLLQQLFL